MSVSSAASPTSVEAFARRASDPELAVAVLADRGQASRIVILREGDGDRLALAARLVEQKHLIADPALENFYSDEGFTLRAVGTTR